MDPCQSSAFTPSSLSVFLPSLVRYFRKGGYFGLACFANMPVESELERGARMKSVGILCPSYTLLYRYMHFLENQVRLDMLSVVFVSYFLPCAPAYLHSVYLLYFWPNLVAGLSLYLLCFCSFVQMFPSSIKHESQLHSRSEKSTCPC